MINPEDYNPFWMPFFAFLTSIAAAVLAYLARKKTEEVHTQINSRLDELVRLKEGVAHAAGVKQERDEMTAQTTRTAVITTDHVGTVLVWSTNATVLFGWSHVEAVGKNIADLIIPDAYRDLHYKSMKACHDADRQPRGQPLIFRCKNKAGMEFFCDVTLAGQKTGGEWVYTGTLQLRSETFD